MLAKVVGSIYGRMAKLNKRIGGGAPMAKRVLKRAAIVVAAIVGVLACVTAIALIVLHVRTGALHDDYSAKLAGAQYSTPVQAEGVQVITQDVSCGYAVIEMFSAWDHGSVTEKSLYDEYGKVVTSTGQSFADEMNKQFPAYQTTMRKYLTDSELLAAIHDSLAAGVPVPIEWAAKYGDEWTLHYSLVTGLDIPNDKVTVANPYGYVEELPIADFLRRTSFEAYENMPLFLKLGFAFGIFEENTAFVPERRAS